jgi:thiol-disulfide isomerase/thioredoxin
LSPVNDVAVGEVALTKARLFFQACRIVLAIVVSLTVSAATAAQERTNNAWEMQPIVLQGLDGKTHKLSDWKGKVIMLNFWASWCAPCLHEIPEFVQYQRQHADRGLQIIGIGIDQERKLRNVQRTLNINYPVLILDPDNSRRLLVKWGNQSGIVPYTIVINAEGRMTYMHRGPMGREEFQRYVLPVLN